MQLWQCVMWGVFGGVAVEGLEWSAVMRRGRWPWNKRLRAGPIIVSVLIRLGVGGVLAGAVGASGPMSQLSALSVGIAAPLIIEKMAQQIPGAESGNEPSTAGAERDGRGAVTRAGEANAL
ncbi:hypothetical protein [Actinoplanes rectilineatus]|uniref:hypothetical protein n=1 Tax=Actinoplanes rectilineatus TaxID=113571 RepID=UPI0012F97FAC|nr:hypothetical protein [Actinoplanes rectilineatus]